MYDATGNRQSTTSGSTTTSSTTGANNTLITDGTYNYEYDADGNRIEQTDIATGAYTTYAYDYRNELTAVTSYTSAGVVTQTVTYTYDALGRQVSETVAVAGGATTETKFVYDGQAIVATLDGTNALTNRYLDGPMVDQVFADEQFDPTEAGELPTAAGIVLYPLVDNQGTARDLVEYDATTATTTIVNHIAYTAFGAVTSQTDTTINYLFGYTGFVHDTATGLDKSMTRYYDAVDGLWTQNDPIGFAGGQANISKFAADDPVRFVDRSGLDVLPNGLTQQQLDEKIQEAKDKASTYSTFGTPLASSLLKHFGDGTGTDFVLSSSDLDRIVGTKEASNILDVFRAKFKGELAGASLTPVGEDFDRKFNGVITYPKPTSKFDRSDSADMFYSFHNLYVEVTFSGTARCSGATNDWSGVVAFDFHDNYAFANRNWQPIPGQPNTTDDLFWLWQEYGGAASFKVYGVKYSREQFSVLPGGGSPAAGGIAGGGGYGGGTY